MRHTCRNHRVWQPSSQFYLSVFFSKVHYVAQAGLTLQIFLFSCPNTRITGTWHTRFSTFFLTVILRLCVIWGLLHTYNHACSLAALQQGEHSRVQLCPSLQSQPRRDQQRVTVPPSQQRSRKEIRLASISLLKSTPLFESGLNIQQLHSTD